MRRDQRDDLRYAGETILGRADWGDRASDYEHGFRTPEGREAERFGRYAGREPQREYEPWPRGEIRSRESREHWRMPGEHTGRGPKGYQRTDERIWEDVCDRLTDDAHVDATDIEVRVDDGEVTLDGTVRSRDEKHHAEDIIDNVPGVRDVHNRLHISREIVGRAGAVPTPLDISSPGGPSRRQVEKAAVHERAGKRRRR